MVTVDPDRDSGEVLDAYLGHFFERTVSLRTEDPAELLDATNAFGVQFEVADHQAGDDAYEVSAHHGHLRGRRHRDGGRRVALRVRERRHDR